MELDESALGATRDPVVHQSQQGRRASSRDAQGRRRPDAPAADQDLHGIRERSASAPASWNSRSCCCAPTNCGSTTLPSSLTTGGASATCSSTSSRTPTRSSTRWALMVAGQDGCAVRSGRRRSVHLPLARRARRKLTRFLERLPEAKMYRLEQNYRSTGNILEGRQRADLEQHRPAGQESLDRGQRTASASGCTRRSTSARGRVRHEAHPRVDRIRAARGATWRSCIARTRSRACSKKS